MLGYSNDKIENPRWNSVRENVNNTVLTKSGNTQLYPLNMCQSLNNNNNNNKNRYVHDLLDVLDNPTQFKLNQIRKEKFQLNVFDTAVTLK